MDSIIDKYLVLKLNANWQPIGWTSPRKAFVDMCGGEYGGTPPALALDLTLDSNGGLESAVAVKWDAWKDLPVRECDLGVSTRSGAIRCPMVIVAPNYAQMPVIAPRLTKKGILERDGYRCAYTDEKLPASQLNIDHVLPRSRGGRDTWENLVACRKDINFKKGNKTNKEAKISLIRKPTAPKSVPKSFTIREIKRPEHAPFIKH